MFMSILKAAKPFLLLPVKMFLIGLVVYIVGILISYKLCKSKHISHDSEFDSKLFKKDALEVLGYGVGLFGLSEFVVVLFFGIVYLFSIIF